MNNRDFWVDQGTVVYGGKGNQLLSALYELIKGTLPFIAVAFDKETADPDSFLGQSEELAVGAYIEFCISCLYEPAYLKYGRSEGSLLLDALFAKCHNGRLPGDELFQLYLEYPIFDDEWQTPKKAGRTPGKRIFQFVCDVLGHPDFGPHFTIQTAIMQFMLDAKLILVSADPELTAADLVSTFGPRLMDRLEGLDNSIQAAPERCRLSLLRKPQICRVVEGHRSNGSGLAVEPEREPPDGISNAPKSKTDRRMHRTKENRGLERTAIDFR